MTELILCHRNDPAPFCLVFFLLLPTFSPFYAMFVYRLLVQFMITRVILHDFCLITSVKHLFLNVLFSAPVTNSLLLFDVRVQNAERVLGLGNPLLLCLGGGFARGPLLSVDNLVSAGVLTLVSSEEKGYADCVQVGYSSAGGGGQHC